MSKVKALDSKMTIKNFFSAMGGRFQQLLASTMTSEEKLVQIIKELENQVQAKRRLAREIGAQMRAISDPETSQLEPLEAAKAKREKLIKLGATLLNDPEKKAQLGQVSQEVESLSKLIKSQQATYDQLKESYELARDNYQQALNALETVRTNGPAMLKSIEAHKQALAMRDAAANQDAVDTSFMDQLAGELAESQAELRSDEDLDNDLDASSNFNVDAALAKLDEGSVDAGIMAEFQAAAEQQS